MRKLVYHVGTTLDNYISHEDGSVEGFLWEGDHTNGYIESLKAYDTVLMGRVTYEWGVKFGGLKPGQTGYLWMKNYIFSKTLRFDQRPDKQLEIIDKNELDFVRQLKAGSGTDIYLCGGGTLAAFLLEHELIDELIIKLYPILFGHGIRLFGQSTKKTALALSHSKTYNNGVLLLTYKLNYP